MINAATRRQVRTRAGDACEYCALRQEHSPLASLHVEHIIPRKHGGGDSLDNLALACIDCNLAKGTNLTGIDPLSDQIVQLFHPRRQRWEDHFAWQGVLLTGKTAEGRATIEVLRINSEEQVQLRSAVRGG
ncbi:MAG TPA: HNH endonuclease [Pirellulales bacterium]|jgi:5-methylcytosine-specific restriction endonuclease McrA